MITWDKERDSLVPAVAVQAGTPYAIPQWRRRGQRRPNTTPQQLPAAPIDLSQREGKFLKYGFGFPSPNHSFTTTAEFPHVLLLVLRHGGITCSDAAVLRRTNISFRNLIDAWLVAAVHTPHLVSKPNPDETEISGERVAHMCILALRANLIPGNIIRALGPSVAGYDRMLQHYRMYSLLQAVLTNMHYNHFLRTLHVGAPNRINAECRVEERLASSSYGNHKAAHTNGHDVEKCLQKDIRNRHSIALPGWTAMFMPHVKTNPLSVIIKMGKKPRVIYDLSHRPLYVTIDPMTNLPTRLRAPSANDYFDVDREYHIGYINTFRDFLEWIFNLRISYPREPIYLTLDDITAAFKHVPNHPDTVGATACLSPASNLLILNAALVFGANISPPEFAIYADAKSAIADFLVTPTGQQYLQQTPDFIKALTRVPYSNKTARFVAAEADSRHQGVLHPDKDGTPHRRFKPNATFVDDTPHAEIGKHIELMLRASVQALFMLLPESVYRPETLSRDKLLNYSESHTILGLTINTRAMRVELPADKLKKIKDILDRRFKHEHFQPFHAAELLGLIRHASSCLWWLPIYTASLQTALTEAIRAHSSTFNEYWNKHIRGHNTYRLNYKHPEHEKARACNANFWSTAFTKIKFTVELRSDILFLTNFFNGPDNNIQTDIAYIIKRPAHLLSHGDASKQGIGAICHQTKTIIYLECSPEVKSAFNKLYAINDLETAALLLQYVAFWIYFSSHPCHSSAWPVIQLFTDNITAKARFNKCTSTSWRSRHLLRIMAILSSQQILFRVDTDYIEGVKNTEADLLSRDFQHSLSELITYHLPHATGYRVFSPSEIFLNIIGLTLTETHFSSTLQKRTKILHTIKPKSLGTFVSIASWERQHSTIIAPSPLSTSSPSAS